jgi:hypothetical protein
MAAAVRRRSVTLVLATGLLVAAPQAWAHGDHGAAPAGVSIVAPRAEARIGADEVVVVFANQALAVFVSRFADGAPLAGAKVAVSSDLQSADLEETDSGLYVTRDILLSPGHNDLTISLTVGGVTKTQSVGLIAPHAEPANGAAATPTPVRWATAIGGVGSVALLAATSTLLWRRLRRLDGISGIGLRWQRPA